MFWKKMFRDILSNKGSYIAYLVLIVIGLITFMACSIATENLKIAKNELYEEQNFADGFIELSSMPKSNLERLSRIEGIENVSGRVVKEIRLNEDSDRNIYLRLVSLNLDATYRLNDARLQKGENIVNRQPYVWLDTAFVKAHELKIGDKLNIITGGRNQEIIFNGISLSPEFVYMIRTETDLLPNPEQFGAAHIPLETMWSMFPDTQGRVNDVVFTLEPGADFDTVKDKLELELEAYGVTNIYPRADHTSHFMLIEEIEVIESLATFFPLVIFSIAGFIIFILLKRLVEQQRVQIGIMKAFGYTNREIFTHYLSYALVLGFVGGLIGGLLGMWLANPLTTLLYDFFYLPEIYEGFSLSYLFIGILFCLIVLGFAGYIGCKNALELEPAEAMRPPAPVSGKKNFLEKLNFFSEMLTIQGKMAIRNLGRSRSRSALIFIGIMVSTALVAFTWSLAFDAMPRFLFYQYEEVEVYDAKVSLVNPLERKTVQQELELYNGITLVEPLAEVPVTLSNKWFEEDILLLGNTSDSQLYNIRDSDKNRIYLKENDFIISERLASNLGLKVGSTVKLESPFMRDVDESVKISVTKIIPQYIGMNAYMELSELEQLMGQGSFATSFMIKVDDSEKQVISSLRNSYRESDFIAGIDTRSELIQSSHDTWEAAGGIIYLYVMLGMIFSFAIVYISNYIILSERNRELASMKVLGMTNKEVLSVISFEQWFLSFFAMLAGAPLAKLLQAGFATEFSTDMYAMPTDISIQAIAMGILLTVFSIWFAQRFALKKIKELDLVEVLKSRE
ncbi:hypothetical protein SYNTR_0184 [Candidatus Syntrophocurvum alkaliphilum]|uniref:ABC3 transporter permease C-terminal domain-containing protein n=1 Tax=Candidatus Syntrophocurvum alkaliphilum TaxID=2293317 RepID=A0A6I6D851_9FIRM|nr:ABC transporter permease [Candidatus Syntrophocurvum alkaliphilum]QGT98777.1 hypothetical protein SYNTR_0184 [Candidatus Syntrophocurvum alkaliphilum]